MQGSRDSQDRGVLAAPARTMVERTTDSVTVRERVFGGNAADLLGLRAQAG
ncbi:hypothetical protein [Streptomyces sp. NPDC052107]|uniref:hypothetical protein n=1 Tax=Streptomyces sp. NPDC052107 TaxID=3155632 RepID=UPI00341F31D4